MKVNNIFDKMQNDTTHQIFTVPKFQRRFGITIISQHTTSNIFNYSISIITGFITFEWNRGTVFLRMGVVKLHYMRLHHAAAKWSRQAARCIKAKYFFRFVSSPFLCASTITASLSQSGNQFSIRLSFQIPSR